MPGFVAVLVVHLHFPAAGSLKGKRKELQSIKAQLRGRLGVSVAEVDHQDLWQRSTLLVAVAAGSATRAQEAADAVERWLHARVPEGVRVERSLSSAAELCEHGEELG